VTSPLDVVRPVPLLTETSGRPEIVVGRLDGSVDTTRPMPANGSPAMTTPRRCLRSIRHARTCLTAVAFGLGTN
jgi:hypothetical protein